MARKVNTEIWLKSLPVQHTEFYNYSRSVYTKAHNKIEIICPIHGSFWQDANSHKNGCGCRKCGIEQIKAKQRFSTQEFINSAVAYWNGRYAYDCTKYINNKLPIDVRCLIHGVFKTDSGNHLSGKGCPHCGRDSSAASRLLSSEGVLSRLEEVHKGKYQYPNFKYLGMKSHIDIICNTHGIFSQNIANHINGQGCPDCAVTGFSNNKAGYFYVLVYMDKVKVGITNISPQHRANLISKSSKQNFEVLKFYEFPIGKDAREIESVVLSWLRSRYTEDVMLFEGSTECFPEVNKAELMNYITEVINKIKSTKGI